jgi:hypothetical protein
MTGSFQNGRFYGLHVVRDDSQVAGSAARILTETLTRFSLPFTPRSAPSPQNLSPLRLIVGKNNW